MSPITTTTTSSTIPTMAKDSKQINNGNNNNSDIILHHRNGNGNGNSNGKGKTSTSTAINNKKAINTKNGNTTTATTTINNSNSKPNIAVIGGGLVGSMISCFLAKRGFNINLYEMRKDPRKSDFVGGKSINLALSERGRIALRLLGLEQTILDKYSIKMYSRMIHDLNGKKRIIPYGTKKDQYILSVGRRFLNEILLSYAEKFENVHLNFEHKLIDANLKIGQLKFSIKNSSSSSSSSNNNNNNTKNNIMDNTNDNINMNMNIDDNEKILEQKADIILGCDGAYSTIRRYMIKLLLLDYSQKYIEHGYMELCIPATKFNDFAMEPNHLHIWPRGDFMMIALPNLDRSFTVTLFMPFKYFEKIKTELDLLKFFEENFKDSIPLLTKEGLIKTFFNSKPNALISIKCSPYHFEDKVLLMGDAAHAMVPFYGQGMNCGFEDCFILDQLLQSKIDNLSNKSKLSSSSSSSNNHNTDINLNDFGEILQNFTNERVENCHAIIDLAMYNYIEMRDLVNRRTFYFRKLFDNFMHKLIPNYWIPLYSMVTFSRLPYKRCIQDKKWQDSFIELIFKFFLILFGLWLFFLTMKYFNDNDNINTNTNINTLNRNNYFNQTTSSSASSILKHNN